MTKHRLLPFLGLVAVLVPLPTSAQQWEWAESVGWIRPDHGRDVAVDASGNAYVTGIFQGTATFGSFTLMSAGGSADLFVAKYDSFGDVLWARSAGGGSYDGGYGIAVTGSHVYVTGHYGPDVFVAKYGHEGELLWTSGAGGYPKTSSAGLGIAVDVDGNAYATGYFTGEVTFGQFTLLSAGSWDAFVVKYDPAGEVLWARRAGGFVANGAPGTEGWGIAVDIAGNAYVTGGFTGTADFGPFRLTSAGYYDVFIAKYGPTGDVLWALRGGGEGRDLARGIAVDADGDPVVVGSFYGSGDFGPYTLTAGGYDVFVVKYDSSGEVHWASSAGGDAHDGGNNIALDGASSIYVTGYFQAVATFEQIALTSVGESDVFVVKYNELGDVLWTQRAGGAYYDQGEGIAVDADGGVYVTGHFLASVDFGPFILTSAGDADVFLTRLDDSVTAVEYAPAGSNELVLSAFSPQPADVRAVARLTVHDLQRVRVVLHDALGRELAVLFNGTLAAGAQRLVEVDVSSLLPGVYVVRVAGATATIARRLIVAG